MLVARATLRQISLRKLEIPQTKKTGCSVSTCNVSTLVAEVRRRVFMSALVQAAHCQRKGYALATWQVHGEPDIHLGEPVPNGYIKAWTARVHGARINEMTRQWIYCRLPELRDVYENILWLVLNPKTSPNRFDVALKAMRLNGKALPPYSVEAPEELCGCPNWQRLGYLLIVLCSQSVDYIFTRMWIKKNFTLYCAQACLISPWRGSALLLFDLLDQIWRTFPDAKPFYWPARRKDYAGYLAYYQCLGRAVIRQGWAEGWGHRCLMWLWHLIHRENSCALVDLRAADRTRQLIPPPIRLEGRVLRACITDQRTKLCLIKPF